MFPQKKFQNYISEEVIVHWCVFASGSIERGSVGTMDAYVSIHHGTQSDRTVTPLCPVVTAFFWSACGGSV